MAGPFAILFLPFIVDHHLPRSLYHPLAKFLGPRFLRVFKLVQVVMWVAYRPGLPEAVARQAWSLRTAAREGHILINAGRRPFQRNPDGQRVIPSTQRKGDAAREVVICSCRRCRAFAVTNWGPQCRVVYIDRRLAVAEALASAEEPRRQLRDQELPVTQINKYLTLQQCYGLTTTPNTHRGNSTCPACTSILILPLWFSSAPRHPGSYIDSSASYKRV